MATLKDVALAAGVSVRMAARALSGTTLGKRRDARERAERILRIAKELGYCHSDVAISLARGKTHTIGLLLPNLTDMFFAAASEIAMDEAAKQGYTIIIRLTRFRSDLVEAGIERFRASRVDGILFGDDCRRIPATMLDFLRNQCFPLLFFSHIGSPGFSSVAPDHSTSIRQAVEMLARSGHAQIALALLQRLPHNLRDAELFLESCSACGVKGEVFWQEHIADYATLAIHRPEALLIIGKYSMRAFLDSIADDPSYQPDLIGFYSEWTWAQATNFRLRGCVMDQAEEVVRTAVRSLIAQIADHEIRTVPIASRFYPEEDFPGIHVLNLSNQYLFDEER